MYKLVVLAVCVQVCLVQTVFSQCIGNGQITAAHISNGYGLTGANFGSGYTALGNGDLPVSETYGGEGEGNVAVIGELPVVGNTAIVGHVPILGAVSFVGEVPAFGSVTITGRCSCGCEYQ